MSGKSEKLTRRLERIEQAINNKDSPWYARNTLWAPVGIGVGLVAAAIVLLYPSIAIAFLLLAVAFICLSFSLAVGIIALGKKRTWLEKCLMWFIGSAIIGGLLLPIWMARKLIVPESSKTKGNAELDP